MLFTSPRITIADNPRKCRTRDEEGEDRWTKNITECKTASLHFSLSEAMGLQNNASLPEKGIALYGVAKRVVSRSCRDLEISWNGEGAVKNAKPTDFEKKTNLR